jgi:quercetin dioxygenase-like cupin family protein
VNTDDAMSKNPVDLHSHFAIDDVAAAVTIQSGAVVSKVVYRDEIVNVTVFGFGAGEELTEHRTARPAVVQVLAGRLHFTANGEELDAEPGFWLYMPSGTPHSLVAVEPTVMLLTLLRP